jgi:3-oxoacyl-[acyl-carrier protein] reductase
MVDLGVGDGVRVNAINPGWIETEGLNARLAAQAKGQGIDGDEVRRRNLTLLSVKRFGRAGQLACFLTAPAAGYIHGALIDLDGGGTRHL